MSSWMKYQEITGELSNLQEIKGDILKMQEFTGVYRITGGLGGLLHEVERIRVIFEFFREHKKIFFQKS